MVSANQDMSNTVSLHETIDMSGNSALQIDMSQTSLKQFHECCSKEVQKESESRKKQQEKKCKCGEEHDLATLLKESEPKSVADLKSDFDCNSYPEPDMLSVLVDMLKTYSHVKYDMSRHAVLSCPELAKQKTRGDSTVIVELKCQHTSCVERCLGTEHSSETDLSVPIDTHGNVLKKSKKGPKAGVTDDHSSSASNTVQPKGENSAAESSMSEDKVAKSACIINLMVVPHHA